jgi:chemotaxis protein MotB
MKKNKQEECPPGVEPWMATYGDMVTLLLCFFVLLFSFSTIDAEKFKAVAKSFQGSLGVLSGGKTIYKMPYVNAGEIPEDLNADALLEELEQLKELKKMLDEYSEIEGLDENLIVDISERGVVIRVLDKISFDRGNAEIKEEAVKVLDFVSDTLKQDAFRDRHIKIEGHTDADPMHNGRYDSNWELSAARAMNVVKYFQEVANISGDRLSGAGYGEFRPIAPNDTDENKAKNRRVDIIILKKEYQLLEPTEEE